MRNHFKTYFKEYKQKFEETIWFQDRVKRRNTASDGKEEQDRELFQLLWHEDIEKLAYRNDLDERNKIKKIKPETVEKAKRLIANGSTNDFILNINCFSINCWTVCDVACARGCLELVKTIFEKWPEEVFKKDINGQTPLSVAFRFGQNEVWKWFDQIVWPNGKELFYSWAKSDCSGGQSVWQVLKSQKNIETSKKAFEDYFGNFGSKSLFQQGVTLGWGLNTHERFGESIPYFSEEFGVDFVKNVLNRYGIEKPIETEPLLFPIKRKNGKTFFLSQFFHEREMKGTVKLKKEKDNWVRIGSVDHLFKFIFSFIPKQQPNRNGWMTKILLRRSTRPERLVQRSNST